MVTLTVESELGKLGTYLSVSDEDVAIILFDKGRVQSVSASLALNVMSPVASDYSFGFEAEVLDENHIKIADLPPFNINSEYDYNYNGGLHNYLNEGNVRAQMEGIYFDEIGLSGEEASKLTLEQLAQRYAQYKVKRGTPLAPWS